MDQLAATLARAAGRPIVNKTGLTGSFEFTLNFSFGGAGRDGTTDDRPNIFTAIRDQLGLELAPEDNPLDVLVIDHIQRPSEN